MLWSSLELYFVNNYKMNVSLKANPFDMDALCLRLCEAEAERVHSQRRNTKQLHRCSDQARCDDVVYEECTIVGEKHTPGQRKKNIRNYQPSDCVLRWLQSLLLEFDFSFIQKVHIKEPSEEQIQTTERIKYKDELQKVGTCLSVSVCLIRVPGQTEGGQDDDHEDQQEEALVHRYLVLSRSV